ncbi:MAG: AtpZ/AtpI family protein [Acidimicrobiales bacterium]|jgi:hypothetical protein|nr:AtpZ/AtpI family protein [Acidimicrobiales bacterium]
MSEREQRNLREGAGDAFSAAFELIVTPAIFGLLGWVIDRQLDLFPVFTLALTFVVLTYEVWKLYRNYSDSMDIELEARRAAFQESRVQEGTL